MNATCTPVSAQAPRWQLHTLAAFAASVLAGVFFIHEPGFGDELGYWSLAFDLHEVGGQAWSPKSFHDLRWPVWGMCWLWQGLFGPGLASYFCTPIFYLAAVSVIAFTFGRLVLGSIGAAWGCAIILWFAPVLDPVISRPMPDLSEAFYGGCALLAWWGMMQAETTRRRVLLGAVSGFCIGLAFSNRVTGVFITPVLAIGTFVLFPKRWKWLLVPAAVSLIYVLAEGAAYRAICGDLLHGIHANLGGRGAKDTQPIAAWQLPVRYLNGFFKANRLAPIYAVSALIGIWGAWRRGPAGRLVVIWFATLYLEYSCAVQSVHPVRPLIGSTFRYVGAFSMPLSMLSLIGLFELGQWLRGRSITIRLLAVECARRPLVTGVCACSALALYSSRPLFDLGFVKDYSRRMAALPAGTKVFSHHTMRNLAFLIDPRDARRLDWTAPVKIIKGTPELEQQAAQCDQFWYLRKHMWLTERKAQERSTELQMQPPLPSYLDTPERDWVLDEALNKGDEPELVFFSRRQPGMKPHLLGADGPELSSLVPKPTATWTPGHSPKHIEYGWAVPASMRGYPVLFQSQVASPAVEPVMVKLRFTAAGRRVSDVTFRPIVYGAGGKEFLAMRLPASADRCWIRLDFNKNKEVRLSGFRAVYDDPR